MGIVFAMVVVVVTFLGVVAFLGVACLVRRKGLVQVVVDLGIHLALVADHTLVVPLEVILDILLALVELLGIQVGPLEVILGILLALVAVHIQVIPLVAVRILAGPSVVADLDSLLPLVVVASIVGVEQLKQPFVVATIVIVIFASPFVAFAFPTSKRQLDLLVPQLEHLGYIDF